MFGHVYWVTTFLLVIFPAVTFLVLATVLCGRHCREEDEYYHNQGGGQGGWQGGGGGAGAMHGQQGQWNQSGMYGQHGQQGHWSQGGVTGVPAHAGGPYQGGYDVNSAYDNKGFTGRNSNMFDSNSYQLEQAKYGVQSHETPDFTRGPASRPNEDPFGGRGP